MDLSTRLRRINPTNTVFYSPQPRAEVYCLLMNFKISKLTYCRIAHILGILLMNSCNTDIFFSNYYNLQSVHFEYK